VTLIKPLVFCIGTQLNSAYKTI